MYYVYVIWSDKLGKRYTGSTKNVEKRLKEHNIGKTPFTSRGIPWNIIHLEDYTSLTEARRREKFLKSGKGRELLDSMYPKMKNQDLVC